MPAAVGHLTSEEAPLARAARLALLALLLVAAGCTHAKRPPAAAPTTTAAAPAGLRIALDVRVRGTGDAGRAAAQATPGLQRFLDDYLTTAFVGAAGRLRTADLLALFDAPVRAAAQRQLDALSLGGDAGRVSAVRPGRAAADAVVLADAGRPLAATVRLDFDGTADSAQGSGPLRLRAVFQLVAAGDGWRIAAFSSRTGAGT